MGERISSLFGLALLSCSLACTSGDRTSFADCPITAAPGPVPAEVRFERPVPWVREDSGWFGNSSLWVSLPPDGILPTLASPEDPDEFSTKFPWWRLAAGELAVETKRLEASDWVQGSAPAGYGQTGFNPSGLVFDGQGCWEVTGRAGEQSLSFVVWVCPTDDFGERVSAVGREACGAM